MIMITMVRKVAFSLDGFLMLLNSHQLNALAFCIDRVPIPSCVNALTVIVMINVGPCVKVFYTYIISIIIKFIVEWRAMQYHGRFQW